MLLKFVVEIGDWYVVPSVCLCVILVVALIAKAARRRAGCVHCDCDGTCG
jgi:hypothetical protein